MIVRFSLDLVFIPKMREREREREREKDKRAKKREREKKKERKNACTRADTDPSVNGWMNLGEKGCL